MSNRLIRAGDTNHLFWCVSFRVPWYVATVLRIGVLGCSARNWLRIRWARVAASRRSTASDRCRSANFSASFAYLAIENFADYDTPLRSAISIYRSFINFRNRSKKLVIEIRFQEEIKNFRKYFCYREILFY